MKRIALQFLLCTLSFSAVSQNINLGDPLPIDKTIKKGVLPNGMTYYIKNTQVTKGVASYYIIQNVGSILENDNQRGLAHFLEHMAFNGTKNFEGKGILNTMQKYGLSFGGDINAYTSFDETVYNINNIPSTPALIDTGLLVLHDWSHYLLLTDSEIDAERGVIKEEWRTRQGGQMRLFEQSAATLYNNSKYASRIPIGLMDVVDHFKYAALRDFYHDWYRTDLQAIAIIGDIDPGVIEAKIKALFSEIPPVKDPKPRLVTDIAENQQLSYALVMDDEVATASLSFGIRHPKSLQDQTVGSLKEALLYNMATMMLSKRLDELSQKTDAPFLNAAIGYEDHSRTTKALNVNIEPKEDQQSAAFKSVVTEINRAVKFGFTPAELQRTMAEYESFYENQILSRDNQSHEDIVLAIERNYLDNETLTDIKGEYELVKTIFSTLTTEDLHQAVKALYTKKNRFLVVTGIKGKQNLTQKEALDILDNAQSDAGLSAYEDEFSGKTLISNITIKPGKIISEKNEKELGATTFTLSNGIKVHYKFANKSKNEVQLKAISYGGRSLLADQDIPSADFLGNVLQLSGLGDYSATDLSKVTAGKQARVFASVNALTENIDAFAVTKDTETMLQMVYLRFTKPRFDSQGFDVVMQNAKNKLISRRESIQEKMQDSVTVALYGADNPKKPLYSEQYVQGVSFDKIKSIYQSRFANAADFEFFIVGDLDEQTLKPLLEKYIASIAVTPKKEQWKDNSVSWLAKNTDKDVYLKMGDPKGSVNICYKNNMQYSLKNEILARTLASMLTLRFDATLREEEGGTYGAGVFGNVTKRPIQEAFIGVEFDCNPEKTESLIAIVHREINKISAGDIQQADLDKTLANYLKERKQQKDVNEYDMNLLTTFYREG